MHAIVLCFFALLGGSCSGVAAFSSPALLSIGSQPRVRITTRMATETTPGENGPLNAIDRGEPYGEVIRDYVCPPDVKWRFGKPNYEQVTLQINFLHCEGM